MKSDSARLTRVKHSLNAGVSRVTAPPLTGAWVENQLLLLLLEPEVEEIHISSADQELPLPPRQRREV